MTVEYVDNKVINNTSKRSAPLTGENRCGSTTTKLKYQTVQPRPQGFWLGKWEANSRDEVVSGSG